MFKPISRIAPLLALNIACASPIMNSFKNEMPGGGWKPYNWGFAAFTGHFGHHPMHGPVKGGDFPVMPKPPLEEAIGWGSHNSDFCPFLGSVTGDYPQGGKGMGSGTEIASNAAPVPEPSTLAYGILGLFGLLGFGSAKARRLKSAQQAA